MRKQDRRRARLFGARLASERCTGPSPGSLCSRTGTRTVNTQKSDGHLNIRDSVALLDLLIVGGRACVKFILCAFRANHQLVKAVRRHSQVRFQPHGFVAELADKLLTEKVSIELKSSHCSFGIAKETGWGEFKILAVVLVARHFLAWS